MNKLKPWQAACALAAALLPAMLIVSPARAQDFPSLIQAQAPVDYWRLNETKPSPAINTVSNLGSAGAAGTAYVLNGALTGEPGIVGESVRVFNLGQDVDQETNMVDILNLPALNSEPPFTIEFWMKPNLPFVPNDGTNGSGGLILDDTGLCVVSSLSPDPGQDSRSGYLFYALSNSLTFRIGGEGGYAATATANITFSNAAWTHVVGEFDGTNATIYTNGVFAGSGSINNTFHINQWGPTRLGGNLLDGAEYLYLGEYVFLFSGYRGFDGWIDEFAVYNSILSASTIASHYKTATNSPSAYDALVLASKPVGYWNMDEPAFTLPNPSTYPIAADLGSLGQTGTNTYGALADQPSVPGLGADSGSVFYSGEAGSLTLDTNQMEPTFTGTGQEITLAAWIKPATLGVGYAGDIIAQGYDSTLSENYLRIADSYDWEGFGNPDVAYYDVGSGDDPFDGGPYNSAIFPVPPGDIGNWVFLVGTYDGANWNLYRNGVLQAQESDAGTGAAGPSFVEASWEVGSRSAPDPFFGFFFPGSISEACIFTNALDSDTILELYNAVHRPPVITQAPQAPSPVYLGSSATFSVWADGPGTLFYQWVSNNVPLAAQTGTNLALSNLTAAASATYGVIVTNQYGAVTSLVTLVVTPTLPPITLVPAEETRWIGSPLSFAPASPPNQQLSYQWQLDGQDIPGANQPAYTAPSTSNSAGTYTVVISNSFAVATSTPAMLSVLTPPAGYAATIVADGPLSYFRLDETNGTTAYDYAGGNNGTYNGSYLLGQPGALYYDPDFAVTFSGTTNSYVGGIGPTTINFFGTTAEFSIEAWANGPAGQPDGSAVIAKGTGDNGARYSTEQFAITVQGGFYRFYVNDDQGDTVAAIASSGPDGKWHHLVGGCDSSSKRLTFYIDGAVAATADLSELNPGGILSSTDPVGIGAERSGVLPVYDLPYKGTIDEVAIYPTVLSASQVLAHYAASYGTNVSPFITAQPVSVTNYANLPVTLTVNAAGTVPLTYQWNMVGSGPIAGATANSLTIPNLALADAGQYTVGITNAVGGILSTTVTITVLPPPTNPPSIAGLVMHLPFDGNLLDATGRGNDATNEASGGAPLITDDYVPGEIGEAFTYQTTVNGTNVSANYATLGVRPDLQFGANSFTVSMWVQLPVNYSGNDLPFFTDVVNSTFGYPGFCFEPANGPTSGNATSFLGGWGFSIFDGAQNGEAVYGNNGTINDGNWHNLIYVIDRTLGATVYLDGVPAQQNLQKGSTVAGIGSINSSKSATIGQDPTGVYPQSSDGSINIDDLGVWSRALKPLEAAAIFTAGSVNQLSFTAPPTLTLSLAVLSGARLQLSWTEGSLQSSTNLLGPWLNVEGAASPYTTNFTGAHQFFRTKL